MDGDDRRCTYTYIYILNDSMNRGERKKKKKKKERKENKSIGYFSFFISPSE